jgi:hypothetical protein
VIGLRSSSANEGGVAKAVEALRQGTLGQHRGQLEGLGAMTPKATVKALTLSDHVIAAVGANAMIFSNREREHPLRGRGRLWDRRSVLPDVVRAGTGRARRGLRVQPQKT